MGRLVRLADCAQRHTYGGLQMLKLSYAESITGSAFTLTFVNSECIEAQSLLSKDVGEKKVTCELLSAA